MSLGFTFYSTFTGIGGFDLGFERAGMTCTGQVEWIDARRALLARKWPDVPKQGDIRDVTGDSIGRPDLLCGGFPCKQLSVGAPHRQGLDGKDSAMFYEFARVVGEIPEHERPRWLVLENTPGLLSSRKGRDMAAVVMGLEELGYGWAYRVVDGSHLGTPQRRRRVIVVAHRGGDPRPAWAVLGDDGAGSEVAPASHDGQPDPGPGPRPLASADGGLIRIWRKSANSQVSIDNGYAGGYRETWVNDGAANVLTCYDGGNALRQKHLIAQGGRLRTLTLTEWERLSGFPDGWTEGLTLAERYGTLGDTFHVGTAEWLGRRIMDVHAALAAHPRLFDTPPPAPVVRDAQPFEVQGQLALFPA